MSPKLPDQSSYMGPCAPAFQITDRPGNWPVPTLKVLTLCYTMFHSLPPLFLSLVSAGL